MPSVSPLNAQKRGEIGSCPNAKTIRLGAATFGDEPPLNGYKFALPVRFRQPKKNDRNRGSGGSLLQDARSFRLSTFSTDIRDQQTYDLLPVKFNMLFRRRQPVSRFERCRRLFWPETSISRSARYIGKRVFRLTTTPHAIAAGFAAVVSISIQS